ncbi:MAG: ATP-binding protein [Campylobacterota bacterium]
MLNKKLKSLRYYIFTLLYLALIVCILFWIYKDKHDRTNALLQSHMQSLQTQKESIYSGYKVAVDNIYHSLINDEEVLWYLQKAQNPHAQDIARELLYQKLKDRYERIKKFGVEQFHFHTSKGESFLRFHKPLRYGDDLSSIRYSISNIIKYQKPLEGFEMGRIVHGFRFVYPIHYNNNFLGSVEISMSGDAFAKSMSRSFPSKTALILDKNYVTDSQWSEEFTKKYRPMQNNPSLLIAKNRDDAYAYNTFSDLSQKFKTKQPFSVYSPNTKEALSFLPIRDIQHDKVVAYLFSVSPSQEIANVNKDYKIVSLGVVLLALSLYTAIALNFFHKRKLQQTILKKSKELKKKERAMMQQNRLAQMGELINMIAHQWRQPLSAISATANSLSIKASLQKYEKEFFLNRLDKITHYAQHLSSTVDDFRNFFKSNKEMREISLEQMCEDAINIIEDSMQNKDITLQKEFHCHKNISTYPSELRQVILNLLKNAEDAIVERKIKEGIITVTTRCVGDEFAIVVSDNAGGIDTGIIEKIYDPYFTTKEEQNGSGLGLYMSNIIVTQHCKGSLRFDNTDGGAAFTIALSQSQGGNNG